MYAPSLTFTLPPAVPKFGPRVGQITLTREDEAAQAATRITLDTPTILVGTSRGVVPHLSLDHTHGSDAIRWINVPFESFLEQTPPVPTLQAGPWPLHRCLGFDPDRHVASLCLRDPLDVREMPPNGHTYVAANCVRGVKKVSLADWRTYVYKTRPDVVFALTDTPCTPPPVSQKRIAKSIERSAAWVADLLRPVPGSDGTGSELPRNAHAPHPLNVFVHMAGGTSAPAREAFAHGLRETLHGPEAEAVKPLCCLDEGIAGYAFDLAVLRGIRVGPNTSQHRCLPDDFLHWDSPETAQHAESSAEAPTPGTAREAGVSLTSLSAETTPGPPKPDIVSLLQSSLGQLSEQKPRLVTGIRSPHEILRLIRDVGVDLFDVGWAQHAANVGVALDFVFPAPKRDGGGAALGHNLYDPIYARQYVRLADTLTGAGENGEGDTADRPICPCIACSPLLPSSHILHSAVDEQSYPTTGREEREMYAKPYSRAYVHHLLHTHEMSAHTFLVAHNLAVVSAFLVGVRGTWAESGSVGFVLEVEKFSSVYDESEGLFSAAKKDWERVDKARGKGRLARERDMQEKDRNGEDK